MFKQRLKNIRKAERGNVLFLILIAVALFAALSYAVTSSSRSGGGDAADESSLVNSASVTQYPSAVRTAIIRMMVSKSVAEDSLGFNPPADAAYGTTPTNNVFHPLGGGASYASAPADIMANATNGTWYFNANYEILNIGTSSAGAPGGNDIIAFLPNITKGICDKINSELGVGASVTLDMDTTATGVADNLLQAESFPNEVDVIGDVAAHASLAGQPFGCIYDPNLGAGSTTGYIYYHVLIER